MNLFSRAILEGNTLFMVVSLIDWIVSSIFCSISAWIFNSFTFPFNLYLSSLLDWNRELYFYFMIANICSTDRASKDATPVYKIVTKFSRKKLLTSEVVWIRELSITIRDVYLHLDSS